MATLLLALPLTAAAQRQKADATLTYTKILKGSSPEYESVTVRANGTGEYDGRNLADPPDPRSFKLPSAAVAKLFDYARNLHDFQGIDVESHKRVANLGKKTFVYRQGGQQFQCEFNYTLNRKAQELTNLFEGLASVERHAADLEYAMKYDPLGLPRDLTEIQSDLDQGGLTAPELLAPDLQAIIRDSHFLHLAQVRAQRLLEQIQD
jgi:hypothetical protein